MLYLEHTKQETKVGSKTISFSILSVITVQLNPYYAKKQVYDS